eukprot:11214779-Lingulodinium_polyedra.AAC.1
MVPANTAVTWNRQLFNVAVSRATQLATLVGDASAARKVGPRWPTSSQRPGRWNGSGGLG